MSSRLYFPAVVWAPNQSGPNTRYGSTPQSTRPYAAVILPSQTQARKQPEYLAEFKNSNLLLYFIGVNIVQNTCLALASNPSPRRMFGNAFRYTSLLSGSHLAPRSCARALHCSRGCIQFTELCGCNFLSSLAHSLPQSSFRNLSFCFSFHLLYQIQKEDKKREKASR